jgi:DtxR family transcriptional regulator, Mn-dependent transcriptional regulator
MNQNSDKPALVLATDLSESLEDYLEAILAIEGEKRAARPKDIAHRLSVSPPSVTAALQNLAARKLVNYAPYDLVTLTERGRQLALDVRKRHDALRRFFTDLLQLDTTEADHVACHMEHALPAHTLGRLVEFMDFIDNSPHGGVNWSARTGFGLRRVDASTGGGHDSPSS